LCDVCAVCAAGAAGGGGDMTIVESSRRLPPVGDAPETAGFRLGRDGRSLACAACAEEGEEEGAGEEGAGATAAGGAFVELAVPDGPALTVSSTTELFAEPAPEDGGDLVTLGNVDRRAAGGSSDPEVTVLSCCDGVASTTGDGEGSREGS
jgi:hypothetical protein